MRTRETERQRNELKGILSQEATEEWFDLDIDIKAGCQNVEKFDSAL